MAEAIANTLKEQKEVNLSSVCAYHAGYSNCNHCFNILAGLSAAQRRSLVADFQQNKTNIMVATVAFGMGVDKPDIRAVIHYNVARSLEDYVQEVSFRILQLPNAVSGRKSRERFRAILLSRLPLD